MHSLNIYFSKSNLHANEYVSKGLVAVCHSVKIYFYYGSFFSFQVLLHNVDAHNVNITGRVCDLT